MYIPDVGTAAHDTLYTSMFYEYNLDYINDSTISSNLTNTNYDLLLVPMDSMSCTAATSINKYLSKGGKVWFFADPGNITILDAGNPSGVTIGNYTVLKVNSNDSITQGLQDSYTSKGNLDKDTISRTFKTASDTYYGFKYSVLITESSGNALLVKFENPQTGSRVIYSNPQMYISGGDCNYFDSMTATKLFLQTKAWILELDQNNYGLSVTYPHGDKQITITLDDVTATDEEKSCVQGFFDMEKRHGLVPANVNTFFIIPTPPDTSKTGLAYYERYGDTHTIHPHDIDDWTVSKSVYKFQTNLTKAKSMINKAAEVKDYGFYSIRFPYVDASVNAEQAAVDTGFVIDSTYGWYTSMGSLGDTEINNVWFPKQKLLSGEKTNIIEIEIPESLDVSCDSEAMFIDQNVKGLNYFDGVNFPSNYIIGGHIQGVMTQPDLKDGLSKILDSVSSSGHYVSYMTFEQLAKYNQVKNAEIKAYNTSKGVAVEIATSQQIDNFTLKLTSINNPKATYDDSVIPQNGIMQDDNIWYVVKTVGAGSHKIVITQG